MTWQAKVVENFAVRSVTLHLAHIGTARRDYVVQLGPGHDTVFQSVDEGIDGPEGMSIPRDAVEALRDAFEAYLGKPRDDFRSRYEEARDALTVERARVDAILQGREESR